MDLDTRDQVHLTCPDRGQSPQSSDSGPCHGAYKLARKPKFPAKEACSNGMYHCRSHRYPFFLDTGAASNS
jgi:hypothetical protein